MLEHLRMPSCHEEGEHCCMHDLRLEFSLNVRIACAEEKRGQ